MNWEIDFISYEDFKEHVRNTIAHYDEKLKPVDLKRFNHNIIDPVKMMFDRAVYGEDWDSIISNEIFRQRDKSNTNEIGYFHQRLFDYIHNCRVPKNGEENGWDVIFEVPEGYMLDNGNVVHKIYVEMKNKHNTMNSAAAGKTYTKMQNQLLNDDDCACFLVEAIARRSQNIVWETTVDKQKRSHNRIRRVSLDQFYEIVTGQRDAFFKVCMALPQAIDEVLQDSEDGIQIPHDTALEELRDEAATFKGMSGDVAMISSMYMLGFSGYSGFDSIGKNDSE